MHVVQSQDMPQETDSEFLYRTLLPHRVGGRLAIYELTVTHSNPHAHANENQIYIVRDGHGVMRIDDSERMVGPGTLIHIPCGAQHSLTPSGNDPVVLYSIIERLE